MKYYLYVYFDECFVLAYVSRKQVLLFLFVNAKNLNAPIDHN